MIEIIFINASSVVTDREAMACMQALQIQLDRDYLPVWGKTAKLSFCTHKDVALMNPAAWQLVILDNSDEAGALGYHDLTEKGLPLGKIFAKTDIQYSEKWTVTASHELLEMLQDPYINLTAFSSDQKIAYAFEVSDACESLEYEINGIAVSDFVTPQWFEPGQHPQGTKFNFMGGIKAPFELLPGGYIGAMNVKSGSNWTQITAKHQGHPQARQMTYKCIPRVGSRRERRQRGRENWIASETSS